MYSLVMSLFSRDYIIMEIDKLKYQQCFNFLKCVQYNSLSAWFLDGITSTCFRLESGMRDYQPLEVVLPYYSVV